MYPKKKKKSVKGKLMCRACNKVDLKEVPSHANHCAPERRTGQNDRHDALAADFVMMAKRNRVPTMWTPNLENGKATDIGFVFPQHTIQTDVTVVSPDAPSKRGSGAPLQAANAAATVKLKEYQDLVSWPATCSCHWRLSPLVPTLARLLSCYGACAMQAQRKTEHLTPWDSRRCEIG